MWVAFGFAGAPLLQSTVMSRSSLFPGAIARIAPDLTLAQAQRRVDAFAHALRREYPAAYPPRSDWRVRLVPLKDAVVGDVRQPLVFLFGAVGLVLLVGCANVANLLLARATTRGREMAVRQALGGAPSRLMRQLLTESVVLSVLGGLVGVALVLVAKDTLVRLIPDTVPRLNDISIDWGVLAFAFLASLAAGALFGLAPVLHVRGLDVTRVLKLEGRGSTSSRDHQRTRHLLVIGEVALSLVLLSTAGLLVRSFWGLLNVPLGFDPHNVTVVRTRLPYPNEVKEDLYPTAADAATFVRDVLRRTRALPGVDEVALGSGAAVPLDHPYQDQTVTRVRIEGDVSHGDQPLVAHRVGGHARLFSRPRHVARARPVVRGVRYRRQTVRGRDQRKHGAPLLAARRCVRQARRAGAVAARLDDDRRHRGRCPDRFAGGRERAAHSIRACIRSRASISRFSSRDGSRSAASNAPFARRCKR